MLLLLQLRSSSVEHNKLQARPSVSDLVMFFPFTTYFYSHFHFSPFVDVAFLLSLLQGLSVVYHIETKSIPRQIAWHELFV